MTRGTTMAGLMAMSLWLHGESCRQESMGSLIGTMPLRFDLVIGSCAHDLKNRLSLKRAKSKQWPSTCTSSCVGLVRMAMWATTLGLFGSCPTHAQILDPATDQPGGEWCYLAKSTTVIGVPFQPDVTQVTFDGALFTGSAELCFFYGAGNHPLLARQKTFAEGWIPIVQYAWKDGNMAYDIEYFAASIDGESADDTVNFVQIRMHNTGTNPATGEFAAALRHNGE